MHEEQLTSRRVHCPYCDAPFDLLVDTTQGSHVTWEDCHICCAPIQVRVEVDLEDESAFQVTLGRDDEVL
ncbi:CPXCG motif-containing cysteine-rich protein [Halomonas ramblicola]|uniref:CPXCG motif-containing cysteine-rich protein n=1 Tax=Halomonas ramblicola TaxID=747349 RepID=UPI0025B478F0|nr:CPXCG motif-containing cysteine-rich protein [Halomonas ramblicola]MDN3521335.1 CPXCG motif-containing cysteine-rich protein [Halomonas ramblicola]